MDVKLAFLNDDLKKEVYVAQPLGVIDELCPGMVMCLQKELFGQRQASPCGMPRIPRCSPSASGTMRMSTACTYVGRLEANDRQPLRR